MAVLEMTKTKVISQVFLHCLLTKGRIRVPMPADIFEKEFHSAESVLSTFEKKMWSQFI
jgi:hypothetical protein